MIRIHRPSFIRNARLTHLISRMTVVMLVAAALSGCACRPGYIGPYGGVHPGRCFVG